MIREAPTVAAPEPTSEGRNGTRIQVSPQIPAPSRSPALSPTHRPARRPLAALPWTPPTEPREPLDKGRGQERLQSPGGRGEHPEPPGGLPCAKAQSRGGCSLRKSAPPWCCLYPAFRRRQDPALLLPVTQRASVMDPPPPTGAAGSPNSNRRRRSDWPTPVQAT